jgi:hypothetical protein
MRRPTAKQAAAALDRAIDDAVRRECSGIPINILNIGKVFAAGRQAAVAGEDPGAAAVAKYRELAEVSQ